MINKPDKEALEAAERLLDEANASLVILFRETEDGLKMQRVGAMQGMDEMSRKELQCIQEFMILAAKTMDEHLDALNRVICQDSLAQDK